MIKNLLITLRWKFDIIVHETIPLLHKPFSQSITEDDQMDQTRLKCYANVAEWTELHWSELKCYVNMAQQKHNNNICYTSTYKNVTIIDAKFQPLITTLDITP